MNDTTPTGYPEHERMREVQDEARVIEAFIDYVRYGHSDLAIIKFGEHRSDWIALTDNDVNRLMAEHFRIDYDSLQQEKERMFQELREQAKGT